MAICAQLHKCSQQYKYLATCVIINSSATPPASMAALYMCCAISKHISVTTWWEEICTSLSALPHLLSSFNHFILISIITWWVSNKIASSASCSLLLWSSNLTYCYVYGMLLCTFWLNFSSCCIYSTDDVPTLSNTSSTNSSTMFLTYGE